MNPILREYRTLPLPHPGQEFPFLMNGPRLPVGSRCALDLGQLREAQDAAFGSLTGCHPRFHVHDRIWFPSFPLLDAVRILMEADVPNLVSCLLLFCSGRFKIRWHDLLFDRKEQQSGITF